MKEETTPPAPTPIPEPTTTCLDGSVCSARTHRMLAIMTEQQQDIITLSIGCAFLMGILAARYL